MIEITESVRVSVKLIDETFTRVAKHFRIEPLVASAIVLNPITIGTEESNRRQFSVKAVTTWGEKQVREVLTGSISLEKGDARSWNDGVAVLCFGWGGHMITATRHKDTSVDIKTETFTI